MRFVGLMIVGLLLGCGGASGDTLIGSGSNVCVPGTQQACACPASKEGVQACADDGSRFDDCVCGSSTQSSSNGSSSGGGGSGGSSSNSGAGGSCEPQSCLDQGFNCGIADNACGHKIDCGSCDTSANPYNACGDSVPTNDGNTTMGKPNVCGGGCVVPPTSGCVQKMLPPIGVACSQWDMSKPPVDGCVFAASIFPNDNGHGWCCPTYPNF